MLGIRIEKTESGFTVYQEERFVECLTWDEMLAQIVHLTHSMIRNEAHQMLTTEESVTKKRAFMARMAVVRKDMNCDK